MKKLIFISFLFVYNLSFAQIQSDGFERHPVLGDSNNNRMHQVDLDNDGDVDIVLNTYKNYIGWYENLDGQGNFAPIELLVDIGNGMSRFEMGDIDDDGDLDIVAAYLSKDYFAWFENINGLGIFGEAQIIDPNVDTPSEMKLADLNGDGSLDLISFALHDDFLFWYSNQDGQGNFGPQQILSTHPIGIFDIGDIDNDGDLDILFDNDDDNQLYWLENVDGQGDFGIEHVIVPEDFGVFSIILSDLDGDSDLDILASRGSFTVDIVWLENTDGLGNFGPQQIISEQFLNTRNLFVNDIDFDGDVDIVGISNEDGMARWYENTNDQGTFNEGLIIEATDHFFRDIADLDNDGDGDLLFSTSQNEAQLSWFRNEGGLNNFSEPIDFVAAELRYDATPPHAADIDGDGHLDLLVGSSEDGRIFWSKNLDGQGLFINRQIIDEGQLGVQSVFPADIDDDGDIDVLAAVTESTDRLFWYENVDGQGNFGPAQSLGFINDMARQVAAFDAEGDGDTDIILARQVNGIFDGGELLLYKNDGQENFGAPVVIGESSHNYIMEFALDDIDNDGQTDIVAVSYNGLKDSSVDWFRNDNGNFISNSSLLSVGNRQIGTVSIGDFDSDGDKDVVAASMDVATSFEDLYLIENLNGLGEFGNVVELTSQYLDRTTSVRFADLDGDGDMDILCGAQELSPYRSSVSWFENTDGLGNFDDRRIIDIDMTGIHSVGIADFDSDGTPDIFAGSLYFINWYKNKIASVQNKIIGQLKIDVNEDDCASSSTVIPNQLVLTTNGVDTFSTFSAQNGKYQFTTQIGDYSTSTIPNNLGYEVNPLNWNSSFSEIGIIDTANFCFSITEEIYDVSVELYPLSEARAGFTASYALVFQNLGTAVTEGTIELNYDDTKFTFLEASELPSGQSQNLLQWEYTDLQLFETRIIYLDFKIATPPAVTLGEEVTLKTLISTIALDANEADNQSVLSQFVIGSFDPNDIRVLEGAKILYEDRANYLHYIIRFQNTGNAEAINVRVENELSPYLDPQTIQLMDLSHDYRVEITGNNLVSFIFENIYLTDSTSNEANSHGYIAYKIKPAADIEIGDSMLNTASIYFDFNPPIITNTVNTRVVGPPVTYTDVQSSCGPFTWIDGVTYSESIDSVGFLIECGAQSGADSLVVLNLMVNTVDTDLEIDGGTLTALNTNASFQWINCQTGLPVEGANSASFTPTENGEYAVDITQNGCTERSECIFVSVLSSETLNPLSAVKIFPNPNNGQFTIDFGSARILKLRIRDTNGRLLLSIDDISAPSVLPIAFIGPPGVYSIELITATNRRNYRIVKYQ